MSICVVHTACLLGYALVILRFSEARECLKDEALARYPVNIYHCNDPVKTECCQLNYQPTCCEPDSSKNLKEQLMLWGSVIGIVSVAVVLLVCWKRDSYICEGDTLKDRAARMCRCGKKGEASFSDDTHECIEINNMENYKSLDDDRSPTPCTSAPGEVLKIDHKDSPTVRGRATAMSRSRSRASVSDASEEGSSGYDDADSHIAERRSWTLSDKLPPLVGARRPPTAEPLPSTSRIRPLNDILL